MISIYTATGARAYRTIQETYDNLYKTLADISIDSPETPIEVLQIKEAVEILLSNADEAIKEQARQDFVQFIYGFAQKTGLNITVGGMTYR